MSAETSVRGPANVRSVGAERTAQRWVLLLVGSFSAALFLFPLAWSAIASFDASASTRLLPNALSTDNYARLSEYGAGLGRYLLNTFSVSALTVLITVVTATLAGYGFARFRFPGAKAAFVAVLAILMVPQTTVLIPLYTVMANLELINSLTGLAFIYATFQLPFGVYMMRNSFESVPRELEEAALIDGCSRLGALVRVVLPCVVPGVVTVTLFSFLTAWNEFLVPLIFITDDSRFPLPVMLQSVTVGRLGSVDYGVLQAGVTVTMLPCIVMFLLLQRYYVNGLISGALKS